MRTCTACNAIIVHPLDVVCAICGSSYFNIESSDSDLKQLSLPEIVKKCTCGAVKVGHLKHSDWCDLKES